MDYSRYLAYRSVERSLAHVPLEAGERELLRDMAEGLLLARDLDEAERLRSDAAMALSLLVGQRRCGDQLADVLWHAVSDCGPPDPFEPLQRPHALSFAGSV
jgi:hypothetical protein